MSTTAERPTWVPNLLRPPDRGPLDVAHLEESVRSGSFVPFLGAGASSMRPNDRRLDQGQWESVCINLSALYQSLDEQTEQKERNFIRCFAGKYNCDLWESATGDAIAAQQERSVFVLQLALIRLISCLTEIFGLHMACGCTCVASPQDLASRELTGLGEKLQPAIVASLLAAHAIMLKEGEYFESVWSKLVHFGYEHTDRVTWNKIRKQIAESIPDATLDGTVEDLTNRQFDFKRGTEIAISEIAWITQLLWYTLTYKLPTYPTTSELAFRLSLFSRNVPPRVGELAQAAETVADYKALVEQIRKLFQFCDRNTKEKFGCLHLAIAGALNFAFESRTEARQWITKKFKGVASYKRPSSPPIPLALTTNFDMALERAFESLESSYHVVFPAFVNETSEPVSSERPDSEQADAPGAHSTNSEDQRHLILPPIAWMIKTVRFFDNGEKSVDWVVWENKDKEGKENKEIEPKGPVIVKLHGSPLEMIPEGKLSRYRAYYPCIVLPESTYLEMILHQDADFPFWISKALKTPKHRQKERSLWFLGYSISDWNVRLRLYQQLHWTFNVPEDAPKLFAVNREFDRYQSAVFGRLRVFGKSGDLHGVARALLNMKELAKYLQGRK